MKTQKITAIKSALTTLAFIMLVLTMNSCRKDDLSTIGAAAHPNTTGPSLMNPGARMPSLGTSFINIDHVASKSLQADYSVTVYTNGNVLFIGRRNVKFIGRTLLSISNESVTAISKLISASNFLSIKIKEENTPDLPFTITTCTIKQQPSVDANTTYITKSLKDYNNGFPRALYVLRTSIEKQLPIGDLIGNEVVNETK